MNNFDELVNNLLESAGGAMVAGGSGSAFGSPATEIGSTGGSFGNVDSYNTGSTVVAKAPKPLGKKIHRRKKPETITIKSKKKQ
jgi:hypothetical protein